MATLTLNDVVQQLQVNKRATDDVVKTLRDWIELSKDNMLQDLENSTFFAHLSINVSF